MKKQLDRFYKRLVAEGVLKAFLTGLGLGALVIVLTAFFSWMFAYDGGLWLAIGLGAGVLVIGSVLFYFLKFRPAETDVARRVDELGLEERLITMMELEGDDSYIAQRQREDAREQAALACKKESGKKIKISVSAALIAVVSLVVVAGASMATVTGLAAADVVPYGIELIDPSIEEAKYVTVTYSASGGGTVYYVSEEGVKRGDFSLKFEKGGDAPEVYVVADSGYYFIGWSDGVDDIYRIDKNVDKNLTVVANFTSLAEIDDDELRDIAPGDLPGVPTESDDEDGELDYNEFERTDEEQEDSTGSLAGEDPDNNVINGSTTLNDYKNTAYDNINGDLSSSDGNYTGDETDLLNYFLDTLLEP